MVQLAILCFGLASSALALIVQPFSHRACRFILTLAVIASNLTFCARMSFCGTWVSFALQKRPRGRDSPHSKLHGSQHCTLTAQKGNCILGCSSKRVGNRPWEVVISRLVPVSPHLDTVQFWAPQYNTLAYWEEFGGGTPRWSGVWKTRCTRRGSKSCFLILEEKVKGKSYSCFQLLIEKRSIITKTTEQDFFFQRCTECVGQEAIGTSC